MTEETKVPSIGRISRDPIDLEKAVRSLKRILEVREGLTGNSLDRFVKVREFLTDSTILERLDARYYTETEIATIISSLIFTAAATGFTIAGGTISKTLTVNDNFVVSTQLTAIGSNTTHRTSDGTDHTYIDQDLRPTASPSFTGLNIVCHNDGVVCHNDGVVFV